jgi:hypothetical protein
MHLLILLSVIFVLCSVACARPRTQARRLPAWVFETTRADRPGHHPLVRPKPRGGVRGRSEASDFVVAALQGKGLSFGTDGSVASLWGYLRESQTALPPGASQSGDVLFFQTRTPVPTVSAPAEACNAPDHVAIVSSVDSDGRISFVEARDGEIRHGFADPERPQVRRDETGRVLNTFLHPKDINDAGDVPNFAGEMVCAAVRTKG